MHIRKSKKTEDTTFSSRSFLSAIWDVLKLAFKISPFAIGFKFFAAIIASIVPIATAYFIALAATEAASAFMGDQGAEQRAFLYIIIATLAGLGSAAVDSLNNYIGQIIRYKTEAKISDTMFEHFVSLDFWRYDDKNTGDEYERAREFSQFFGYVFDQIAGIFQSFIGIMAGLIGLIVVSPWLSLFMLIAIAPNTYIQYKLSRRQIEHWSQSSTLRRKKYQIEFGMLQPEFIPELRIYNMTKKLLGIRADLREKDEGARMNYERSFVKWRFVGDILEAFAQLGSLAWVIALIANKQQPVGQFIYVQRLVSNSLSSAASLIRQLGAMDEDLAKLKSYDSFIKIPLAQAGTLKVPDSFSTIELKNVTFSYPGTSKKVLDNISLSIHTGSHIAIVGENGAGKSTLIKLLLGLYQPTSGHIMINGKKLSEYDISSWHEKLGVLMQDFTKYQIATIGENIYYGNVDVTPSKERVERALHQSEADAVLKKLPNGLKTPASTWYEDEGGVKLSGGQWQRIALARNFYRQAPVIILDEPTSAIDAAAEAKIFDKLFDKNNKNTVITISHRLTTVEIADTIYVLKEGRLTQEGSHAQLVANKKGEYVKIFRKQLREDKLS